MNKGLEALKSMWLYIDEPTKRQFALQDYKVIESELNDYEETKKDLKQVISDYQDLGNSVYKQVKALEIIRNKKVDVWSLGICYSLKNYHYVISAKHYPELKLTQEEYDLLKEVLL